MYEEILPLLKCPKCGLKLELVESILVANEITYGKLKCSCDELWEVRDGVLDFRVEEQESVNRWSELTKEMTFEELDKMILNKTPQNQQELTDKAIKDIINYINDMNPEFAVDIATGRGMLLNELTKNIKKEFHLICIDLSYVVLRADRLKIQKFNPKIKVSFISCDGTNLPFSSEMFDLVLSFLGISNMGSLIPKALKEAYRVLKPNYELLNSTITIKENSEGFRILKEYFSKDNIENFERFLLLNEVESFHNKAGFKKAKYKMIGEDFGQKNELDLLPYEREWFSIGNVYAKK